MEERGSVKMNTLSHQCISSSAAARELTRFLSPRQADAEVVVEPLRAASFAVEVVIETLLPK
jgi:hypothetical protein